MAYPTALPPLWRGLLAYGGRPKWPDVLRERPPPGYHASHHSYGCDAEPVSDDLPPGRARWPLTQPVLVGGGHNCSAFADL